MGGLENGGVEWQAGHTTGSFIREIKHLLTLYAKVEGESLSVLNWEQLDLHFRKHIRVMVISVRNDLNKGDAAGDGKELQYTKKIQVYRVW